MAFGLPGDPKAAAEGEKLLAASLATIESFWLQGDGPFLLGNSKPTIADLALVCEVTQLEVSDCNSVCPDFESSGINKLNIKIHQLELRLPYRFRWQMRMIASAFWAPTRKS